MTDNDEINELLKLQADRIAELEKLTREPTKVLAVPDLMAKAGFFKRGERVTSQIQTKPLSDEEIIAMADSLSLIHYYDSEGQWSGITNEPMFRAEENRNNERLLEILKPFARAIEERHGIK